MDTYCLFLRRILPVSFFRVLCSPFPPPFSFTNSEEAKSTTWLHPVTGEAVITGHRKTPGNGMCFSQFPAKIRAHTHARKQRPRKVICASRWEKKKKKKGATSCGESRERRRGESSLQQSNSPAPLPSRLSSVGPLRTALPLPPPPHLLHLDTLRHTF